MCVFRFIPQAVNCTPCLQNEFSVGGRKSRHQRKQGVERDVREQRDRMSEKDIERGI